MASGLDHVLPSQVTMLPSLSTAAQKELVAQDTPASPRSDEGSMECAVDHDLPFQVSASPDKSTATQKELDGHVTEVNSPCGSIDSGVDHDFPFQLTTLP